MALTACQQPTPVTVNAPPVPINGIGYVVFSAAITPQSRDLLIGDINKLVTAGAKEIHLAINSPGGQTEAAQGIVDDLTRLRTTHGVTIEAYNVGIVASAASYVYLNAQKRVAAPQSTFLFHAAGTISSGLISAERMRDAVQRIEAYERSMRDTMKAHTRLSDSEAQTYLKRTVVLSSDDAVRDGVADRIGTFSFPREARAWVIRTDAPATPPRPNPPPTLPN